MSYPQNPSGPPNPGQQPSHPGGGESPAPYGGSHQPPPSGPGNVYGAPGGPGASGGSGAPGGPGYGGPQWGGPHRAEAAASDTKGFFAKLFDFSFNTYATASIVKAVYILMFLVIVLYWIVFSVIAFSQSAALGAVVLLILGPIASLFLLVMARIMLEFYIAVYRIAEDVNTLKSRSH